MKHLKLTGLALTAVLLAGTAMAQDKLTAVHAFSPNLIYTKSFLDFVAKVNEAGKGVIEIEVRGGPEAIPMMQQPDAVRDGIVDMVHTPGSFYAGSLPEKDAMVGSNLTAVETRANGGIDLIDAIHQEKMGVKYLGWFDSGVSYNLWMVNEPAFKANGDLDLAGVKLRGNAVYNAFFTNYLGAQVIDLPTGEVYGALEKGVVNATGWTQIGLIDLKWNEFVKYRVAPAFFSTDIGVIVNLEKWNSLSDAAKAILTEQAIAHEAASVAAQTARRDDEFARLDAAGMTEVSLQGDAAARYLAAARDETFKRMREQMEKHPMGLTHYDTLIAKFYDVAKAQ